MEADRAQLELELRQRLRQAEHVYRVAAAETKRTVEQSKDLGWGHPDGNLDRRRALARENAALKRYEKALKQFSDLVIRGIRPD